MRRQTEPDRLFLLSDDAKQRMGRGRRRRALRVTKTVHHLKSEPRNTSSVVKRCPTKKRITAIQRAENGGNKSRRVKSSRTVLASANDPSVFWERKGWREKIRRRPPAMSTFMTSFATENNDTDTRLKCRRPKHLLYLNTVVFTWAQRALRNSSTLSNYFALLLRVIWEDWYHSYLEPGVI